MDAKLQTHVFSTESVVFETAQIFADLIANRCQTYNRVLLMLSGGSSLMVYKQMLVFLNGVDLSSLYVTLTDERMVSSNSSDSNFWQMKQMGIVSGFQHLGAEVFGFLDDSYDGLRAAMTISDRILSIDSDCTVVLAGMGADGHTLGWLPTQSNDRFFELYGGDQAVVYYEVDPQDSDNPHRKRLTCSLAFVQSIADILVFCSGEKKAVALSRLIDHQSHLSHVLPIKELLTGREEMDVYTDINLSF